MKTSTSRRFLARLAARRFARSLAAGVSLATLLATAPRPTQAATLYWDQDGDTSTATGGTGTWTTGTQQWRNGSGTGTLQAWTDTAGTTDTADFAGTAGTVTLGANLGALGLVFDTTGYTLATSAFTLNLGTGGITNNAAAATITGKLNLVGAQSWTNAGTTLTVSAATNNNGFLLTLAGSGAHAISGVISGTGDLTKTDAGTATLSGTNSYTGATTVSAGTLSANTLANGGSNSSIGASSNAAGNLILNGGTLQYTGAAVSTNRLFSLQTSSTVDASGSGALNFTNTGALGFNGGVTAKILTLTGTNADANTLAAVIGNNTAATAVTKSGAGLWVLSGNNTYTGATTVNAGTLRAGVATVTGTSGAFGVGSAVTIANTAGAVLSLNGFNQTITTLAGGGTTGGEVSLGSATLTLTSTTIQAFAGLISGTGGLVVNRTVSGGNAQTLSGPNNYSGGTAINNGILLANSNSALGTGAVTISTGTGQLRIGDNINLANTLNLNGGAGISGQGQLIYANGNTGTYSGAINITASPIAGGLIASTSTGILLLSGPITSSVDLSLRTGIVAFSNTANSFSTMSVQAGTAKLAANNALPAAVIVTIGNSASSILDLAGFSAVIGGLVKSANDATVSNSVPSTISTLTTTGTSTFAGVIANGTGTVALTVNGGALTLTGVNTYTGTTSVNRGTLDVGGGTAAGTINSASALALGGGTLTYTRTGNTSQSFAGTTVNQGGSAVTNAVTGRNLNLGAITRNLGGTVNFTGPGPITTTTANTNGILGGYATYALNDWATSASNGTAAGAITALPAASYLTYNNVQTLSTGPNSGAGVNGTNNLTDDSSGYNGSYTTNVSANSLRFNSSAGDGNFGVVDGNNVTLTSGGILVTNNVAGFYQRIGYLNQSYIPGQGQGGLTRATAGDLVINQNNSGSGHLEIYSAIFGTGVNLVKSGVGYLELRGLDASYTGNTVINGGTTLLTAATTGTSGVVLNAGSLQLGNNDRINNAATVTLNGGTLNLNTRSEGAAGTNGVGALTLTSTSTLDFGAAGNANLIQFAGLGTQTDGTVLQVVNWEGTVGSANGTDRLLFAGNTTDFTGLYGQNEVSFNGGVGYGVAQFSGFYEVFGVTAVPEPATYLSGLLLAGLTGNILRRRRARSTTRAHRA